MKWISRIYVHNFLWVNYTFLRPLITVLGELFMVVKKSEFLMPRSSKVIKYQFPIRVKHLDSSGGYDSFFICKIEVDNVSLYSLLKNVSILSSSNWLLAKFSYGSPDVSIWQVKKWCILVKSLNKWEIG